MKLTYGSSRLHGLKRMVLIFFTGYMATNSIAQTTPTEISSINLNNLFFVTPSFTATETWTNNLFTENGLKKSGTITEISPGINLKKAAGKTKGYLNYSLNILNYSGNEGKSSLQNSLNSSFTTEIIDGHGFIDISGFIAQQTISAFAVQKNSNNNYNTNSTEISTYSLSPYYRGRLSNLLNYEAKYSVMDMRAKNRDDFSSTDSLASLNLSGDEIFGKLSWTTQANHQVISRNVAPNTEVDKLKINFSYPITSKFIFSISGGGESQNYTSAGKQSSSTSGIGLNLSISERTTLAANVENHITGKTHSVSFEHRTPRTSWRVSDVKSISLSNSKSTSGFGSTYDQLFNQFSSIEQDPIKRAQLVNNYLQINGINPNATAINGYLTSGTSLQHTQNISFALLGIRDTITFTAARSTGKRISAPTFLVDDFNNSSTIRQDGFTIAYTHRLTEDTVFSNQFSAQKIYGEFSSQNSQLKSVNISTSTRVGAKGYLTVSARHAISYSTFTPYRETAVVGSLTVQF